MGDYFHSSSSSESFKKAHKFTVTMFDLYVCKIV